MLPLPHQLDRMSRTFFLSAQTMRPEIQRAIPRGTLVSRSHPNLGRPAAFSGSCAPMSCLDCFNLICGHIHPAVMPADLPQLARMGQLANTLPRTRYLGNNHTQRHAAIRLPPQPQS